MKRLLPFVFIILMVGCDTAKQKAKEAVNKTGEIVGKTGSEFAEGVAKGVEKTFTNELVFSESLKKAGLSAGKITVGSTDSGTDNTLTVYLIFGEDFNGTITAKVYSPEALEYGRAKATVKGQKGDAHYFDFTFDKRTNIDSKGKVTLE
jgi:hypothetical protein